MNGLHSAISFDRFLAPIGNKCSFLNVSVFVLAAGLSCLLFTAEVNTIPLEQTVQLSRKKGNSGL